MKGVICNLTSVENVNSTQSAIDWDTADEQGYNWWDIANPERITIPAGVTQVEIFFNCLVNAGGTGGGDDYAMRLFKNGTLVISMLADNPAYCGFGASFGVFDVVATDYFHIEMDNFGSTGAALDVAHTKFCMKVPNEDVLGYALAYADGDQSISVALEVDWAVPNIDTLSTHDGTTGFEVPTGCNYAVISNSCRLAGVDNSTGFNKVLVDAVMVRGYHDAEDQWQPGASYGIIPVVAGEIIELQMQRAGATLNAAYTQLAIEWLS